MWPVLTKVQYEALPKLFSEKRLWVHLGISFLLNWMMGPLVMLGLAWATLPDLPTYRTGVIMVGLARCISSSSKAIYVLTSSLVAQMYRDGHDLEPASAR